MRISHRAKRIAKEVSWIGLGQVFAALGAILGVRLLTSVLPPAIYGQVALSITLATLVQQAVGSPLTASVTRFYSPAVEARKLRAYLNAIWIFGLLVFAVISVMSLASIGTLIVLKRTDMLCVALAIAVFSAISCLNAIFDGMQNAARQRVVVVLHGAASQFLRFVLAAGVVWLFGSRVASAMWGYVAAVLIVTASQGYFFVRKILPARTLDVPNEAKGENSLILHQMWLYGWPFATWGFFTWIQLSADKWALHSFRDTTEVGLYQVLYQLGYYPVFTISGLIVQMILPILFQRAGDGTDQERITSAYKLNMQLVVGTLFLTSAAVAGCSMFHRLIFSLLVSPAYRAASWLLPFVVLSSGLFAAGQNASLSLLTKFETKQLILPKISMALVGTCLSIIGARFWGLTGAVYGNVGFSVCYCVWVLLLARKQYGSPALESA